MAGLSPDQRTMAIRSFIGPIRIRIFGQRVMPTPIGSGNRGEIWGRCIKIRVT